MAKKRRENAFKSKGSDSILRNVVIALLASFVILAIVSAIHSFQGIPAPNHRRSPAPKETQQQPQSRTNERDWVELEQPLRFEEAKQIKEFQNIAPHTFLKPVPDREVTVHLVGDDISPRHHWTSDAAVKERGHIMATPWTTSSIRVDLAVFADIDGFLVESGKQLGVHERYLVANSGARLIDARGRRIFELGDIEDDIENVYVVPQGWHFHWPSVAVGESQRSTVMANGSSEISLVTLSTSPKVFEIDGFLTDSEVEWFLSFGKTNVMHPSQVEFNDGSTPSKYDETQRNSRSVFDKNSSVAEAVTRRAYDLLGMDYHPRLTDAVQIVHYTSGESFKPHMDWFPHGFPNNNPVYENGTNRFATLFVYLNDVDDGGETAFFASTGHHEYDPAENYVDVDFTTQKITTSSVERICQEESKALKIRPRRGSAILFYSQSPRGDLSFDTMHSACPVFDQDKWGANIWVWNRPIYAQGAEDNPLAKQPIIQFYNSGKRTVKIIWFDAQNNAEQIIAKLAGGNSIRLESYLGHTFRFENLDSSQDLGAIVMVEQPYENVFISEHTPRIQKQSGNEYKFEFHNKGNDPVLLMALMNEYDVVGSKDDTVDRASFQLTHVQADGRLSFNLPKGFVLSIGEAQGQSKILEKGNVQAKKGGVAVSAMDGVISVRDLQKNPGAGIDDDANDARRAVQREENEVVQPPEAPTGKKAGEKQVVSVMVLNKKERDVRLQLKSIDAPSKGEKILGKIGAGKKAHIQGIVDQILIVQEQEEGFMDFQTIERIPVRPDMRLILRDGQFADVQYGENQIKRRKEERTSSHGEEVFEVGSEGELRSGKQKLKQDASGKIAIEAGDGEVTFELNSEGESPSGEKQLSHRPKRELQSDSGLGDDFARLAELERVFGG